MKYFKTWKQADAERQEVTREQAKFSLERAYNNVDEILEIPNVYPTMCAFIEVAAE